ncbi:FadR/GntR family transcriptional regulator [Bradyrhizobium sp.]|uniref:FadR/GntR family transcriptional regulator n=1 Tax=Bradyrhizobium sp. TaxID=376 RepID=UPI0026266A88|nr:FadR/GntR family transcriptional regulator [Bradyrhizobium sp.]
MTRQASSSSPPNDATQRQRARLLRPLDAPKSLSSEVVDRLAEQIMSGKLPAGAKLPSEQEMMKGMGVSRTVVREAVAALRARGLVITRQGAGAFVDRDSGRQPYAIDPEGLGSLDSVLDILELRMAVESEAAAIASERATATQIKAIGEAHRVFSRAISGGERAIKEDFAFHQAIAAATQNSRFVEFLDFLGRLIIPRQSIRSFEGTGEGLQQYLARIGREHEAIFQAIGARSPKKAREAMRGHLVKSRERYRELASRKSTV